MLRSTDYYRAIIDGSMRGLWPGCLRAGLWAASGPYGWAVRVRNWLFDRGWKKAERVPIPVISVGNLTLGGTGKTPCVEYIARFFRAQEIRVTLLSRGFGSEQGPNDEALMLAECLPDVPHLQGRDRVTLAKTALEELESELLLLDDGLQHRRLARDLEIVLWDAKLPLQQARLFPRGMLREPLTGCRRAQMLVLTHCDQAEPDQVQALRAGFAKLAPHTPCAETLHKPTCLLRSTGETAPLDYLQGRPVVAFAGIGQPTGFRKTLQSLGVRDPELRVYPDHHAYTREDVAQLREWAGRQAKDCLLLTTHKDLVKLRLPELSGRELWALRIELAFRQGEERLQACLGQVLARCQAERVS